MSREKFPLSLLITMALLVFAIAGVFAAARGGAPEDSEATWTFAVSGDSRNCGDFVMPAIAAKVKAENDAFYWHLGDFRWMSSEDEDMKAMDTPGVPMSKAEYQKNKAIHLGVGHRASGSVLRHRDTIHRAPIGRRRRRLSRGLPRAHQHDRHNRSKDHN